MFLIAVALYVGAVVLFFVAVAPIAGVVGGIGAAGAVAALYAAALWDVLGRVPSPVAVPVHRPPSVPPPAGEQPAYRQYFYGQAFVDLQHVLRAAWTRTGRFARAVSKWIVEALFDDTRVLYTWPLGLVAYVALAGGLVVGGAVVALAALVHVVTVAVSVAAAVAGATVLRAVDSAMLAARRIRITCSSCGERVTYPVYACPRCRTRHTDVRPGCYGVLRRRCCCEQKMPTLLLLGTARLSAFCDRCGHSLADRAGSTRELVLPLLGAPAAGKTRLMLAAVRALEQGWVGARDFAFADRETESSFHRAEVALLENEDTQKTRRVLPRAYSIYVTPREAPLLVHMFDAAGELFNDIPSIDELQYLARADTFLLVIDPLGVTMLRQRLPPGAQREVVRQEATRSPDHVLDLVLQHLRTRGARLEVARLAVVVTKSDLLYPLGVLPPATSGPAVQAWLVGSLGLGNFVRSVANNFGAGVEYFCVSSVVDASGHVDRTVVVLLHWAFSGRP